MNELVWYPTPYGLCRQDLFTRFLTQQSPGKVIEIGFGAGSDLVLLAHFGWRGVGLEWSTTAVAVAQTRLSARNQARQFNLIAHRTEWPKLPQADLVVAFEVLEHQRDDRAFLHTMRNLLKPDGWLVLSVPAHQSLWGANDRAAGHIRRYERQHLIEKLTTAGFFIQQCSSIGVPVANLTKPVFDWLVGRQLANMSPPQTAEERTRTSARVAAGGAFARLAPFLFNRVTLLPATLIQHMFTKTDWGVGYFIVAQRNQ